MQRAISVTDSPYPFIKVFAILDTSFSFYILTKEISNLDHVALENALQEFIANPIHLSPPYPEMS